jgi:hypothetical protein
VPGSPISTPPVACMAVEVAKLGTPQPCGAEADDFIELIGRRATRTERTGRAAGLGWDLMVVLGVGDRMAGDTGLPYSLGRRS